MLASYTYGDARQIPYQDEQFDIVLEMGPVYHLQDKLDRKQCLSEAMRVLKIVGLLFTK
ncbi:MAG: class I SAM-dependent methyltransferase [Dysgonamonadaceae bacterium]|nr:class I SAM-dependent methyltransferase [Dysgonamonadaceae bacterium]